MNPTLCQSKRGIDQQIGATIKTLRKNAGISQERLAAAVGVTFQQIQKYEKGTNRVAISTLIPICHALGVQPMDVIGPVVGDAPSGPSKAYQRLHLRLATAEEQLEAVRAIVKEKLPTVSGSDLAVSSDFPAFHVTQ